MLHPANKKSHGNQINILPTQNKLCHSKKLTLKRLASQSSTLNKTKSIRSLAMWKELQFPRFRIPKIERRVSQEENKKSDILPPLSRILGHLLQDRKEGKRKLRREKSANMKWKQLNSTILPIRSTLGQEFTTICLSQSAEAPEERKVRR